MLEIVLKQGVKEERGNSQFLYFNVVSLEAPWSLKQRTEVRVEVRVQATK